MGECTIVSSFVSADGLKKKNRQEFVGLFLLIYTARMVLSLTSKWHELVLPFHTSMHTSEIASETMKPHATPQASSIDTQKRLKPDELLQEDTEYEATMTKNVVGNLR